MYLTTLLPAAAYTSVPVTTRLLIAAPASGPASMSASTPFNSGKETAAREADTGLTDKVERHLGRVPLHPAPSYTADDLDIRRRKRSFRQVHEHCEWDVIAHETERSERSE